MDNKERKLRQQWANDGVVASGVVTAASTIVSSVLGYMCMTGMSERVSFESLPYIFASSALITGSLCYNTANNYLIRHYDKSIAEVGKEIVGKITGKESEQDTNVQDINNESVLSKPLPREDKTTDNIARIKNNREKIMKDMESER